MNFPTILYAITLNSIIFRAVAKILIILLVEISYFYRFTWKLSNFRHLNIKGLTIEKLFVLKGISSSPPKKHVFPGWKNEESLGWGEMMLVLNRAGGDKGGVNIITLY